MALRKKVVNKGKKEKQEVISYVSPVGRLNWVKLAEPDDRDDKYSVELIIKKEDWKEKGKPIRLALIKEARRFFENNTLKSLSEFNHPIKDGDTDKDHSEENAEKNKVYKGCVFFKVHSKHDFYSLAADGKTKLIEDELSRVKSGDYGRVSGSVKGYEGFGGGVTMYLNAFQYARPGEAIGGGASSASLELLGALEDELEDINMDDEDMVEEDVEDMDATEADTY